MTRKPSAKNQALTDQIVAILRDENGFPVATGDIAERLGGHWMTYECLMRPPTLPPRPDCWTDAMQDPEIHQRAYCARCRTQHRMPVWRSYTSQDVRGILNRLAKQGEVEKVVLEDNRKHYWRRDDSDCEVPDGIGGEAT